MSVVEATPGSGMWTINIFPVNVFGKPLGPGLAHFASFQYVHAKDRQDTNLPQLITQDNLDGSYSTHLDLAKGKLPEVALFFGDPDDGAPALVARSVGKMRAIKVILKKIEVLDDHDPCIKGAGELVFRATVAPNASPARALQTRLPLKDHFQISSGKSIALDHVIFAGVVEVDATLHVSITGEELDWPRCLDSNDHLARYVRHIKIPSKTTDYTPDDEANDPESLADWRVWYTVEVS